MVKKYISSEIEPKWMEKWLKDKTYHTSKPSSNKTKNKYILSEFPYPSGDGLHTGHTRIYTGTDVLARYHRMAGYNVLHPMGWDAFGLPAENAAIKKQVNPAELAKINIANFKRQMNLLGLSYDWDREIATIDPDYYAVTQWLFIQFFKLGLLHKKLTPVFYCPFCQTGLSHEEVLANGTHERCGTAVEQRQIPQWIFRITKYADSLLDGLKGLDWPKGALEMQRNWIGKKSGAEIVFSIQNSVFSTKNIEVFTTRPDTLFGVTFLVVAPQIVQKWIAQGWQPNEQVLNYVNEKIKNTDTKTQNNN